jgi:hypothetical protein
MFTLEESALLGRMLRCVGWLTIAVVLAAAGYVACRVAERPHVMSHSHPPAPVDHPRHS